MYVHVLTKLSITMIEYITSGGKEAVGVVQLQSWDKKASLFQFVMEVHVLEHIPVSSSRPINRNFQ